MTDAGPDIGVETWRGSVRPWHIDEMGHMNVRFYLASAAEAEGACLHHLRRPQVAELATVARSAQQIERANSAWYRELAYWAGVSRPAGVGIPAGAIPERPAETTVPSEDFGHPGSLPMTSASDREATFSVLYGTEDAPRAWL